MMERSAMDRFSKNARLLCAILALVTGLCTAPDAARPAQIKRVTGIEEVKAWFNAGQGHPRLIFLLSPT
jgi:hypothetical protein